MTKDQNKESEKETIKEFLEGLFVALVIFTIIAMIPLVIITSEKYDNRKKDNYLIHHHEHQHCELGHRFTHNHKKVHNHSDLEESVYPKDFRFLGIKFTEFKYEQHHTINRLDTCK